MRDKVGAFRRGVLSVQTATSQSESKARGSQVELTDRQIECLRGCAQHRTAKQIGRDLGISHYAVEAHLKAARKKLGVATTLEAVELLQEHMVGPYYGAPELSRSPITQQPQPHGHLNEAAQWVLPGRPRRFWENDFELTTQQTILSASVATLALIVAVALLVAAAQGFYSVFR